MMIADTFKTIFGKDFLKQSKREDSEEVCAFGETIEKAAIVQVHAMEASLDKTGASILKLKRLSSEQKKWLQRLNLKLLDDALETVNDMYHYNGQAHVYYTDFHCKQTDNTMLSFELSQQEAILSLSSSIRTMTTSNTRADECIFDSQAPILCSVSYRAVIDLKNLKQSYHQLEIEPQHPLFKHNGIQSDFWKTSRLVIVKSPTIGNSMQDNRPEASETSRCCCFSWGSKSYALSLRAKDYGATREDKFLLSSVSSDHRPRV